MGEYAIEMNNIHKHFPGVYALKDVTLKLRRGEVLALLGENGAGKSTLMKILSGVYSSDEGEIYINGQQCHISSPSDSRNLGIGTIYQELCLVPNMMIWENFFLGIEKVSLGLRKIQIKEMRNKTKEVLESLGLDIDPSSKVSSLSIAQQQMVEIARAISFNAQIIIMDEPTSSLTTKEVEKLYELIGRLKKNDISIIYISHRMEEIFKITDNVLVMRDGETVGTHITSKTNKDELISMMVGRVVEKYYTKNNHATKEKILEVNDLTTVYNKNVTFDLYKGEILGLTGLMGAGRSELSRALFGIDEILSGTILLNGKAILIKNPRDAIANGLALVPENRREQGLIIRNNFGFNITLQVLNQILHNFKLDRKKETLIIGSFKKNLNIQAFSEKQKVMNLSGGNQQKIVLAKWLATDPIVLILDEPTRGVDVGAKAEIYTIMNQLTEKGVSIIMISSELPEILNMSDRVAVMSRGTIVTIFENMDDVNQQVIMNYSLH